MTDTEKKVLEGFLSKTLKMDTEEVASLYNEAGELVSLTAAAKADEVRIEKLQTDKGDQYKRGIKEGASKLEKALKEKYDIDSDLTGVDLFDLVLSAKIEAVKTDTSDITKHPDYLKKELETEKLLKAKDKEWQTKLEVKETEWNKTLVFNKVKEKALAELDNLRPILPEDARKAQRWKEKYIEEFKTFDYREEDGAFVILKNGEPLKDAHGYVKAFADHVKETASEFFDFRAAEERSGSGNKETESKTFVAPKTNDEYIAQMKGAKTPEERIKVMESYQKTKTK